MRRGLVRWTYLAALVSMLIWIISSLIGGYAYKSADGLVVGDAGVVSPEYTVTVLEVLVKNGDRVHKGDIVAKVSSTRVAEAIANLSAQSSTLFARMGEISAKSEIIDQLVGSAEERDKASTASNGVLQELKAKGYPPTPLTSTLVAEQAYHGKTEVTTLRAEKQNMSRQVPQVSAASRFTDQALEDIQLLFDAGRMKAPMDGFISSVEAGIGSVIVPGAIVAEIVGLQRYVVAYVPVSRLYSLKPGTAVSIEVGFGNSLHGTISRVEPIAGRLPKEFQKTLSPVERQQMIRVDFDEGQEPPPYFAKVTVR